MMDAIAPVSPIAGQPYVVPIIASLRHASAGPRLPGHGRGITAREAQRPQAPVATDCGAWGAFFSRVRARGSAPGPGSAPLVASNGTARDPEIPRTRAGRTP